MDAAQREKLWRTVVLILCLVSLVVSAAAFYGIKRLEQKSKPHVHLIREVTPRVIDPGKLPPKK
jgi:hypothetical protein